MIPHACSLAKHEPLRACARAPLPACPCRLACGRARARSAPIHPRHPLPRARRSWVQFVKSRIPQGVRGAAPKGCGAYGFVAVLPPPPSPPPAFPAPLGCSWRACQAGAATLSPTAAVPVHAERTLARWPSGPRAPLKAPRPARLSAWQV